jgi:hypothetical protein
MEFSSTKAKYMVAILASCEAILLHNILTYLIGQVLEPTMIYCNNKSYIKLLKNPVFHDRSRHIEIRYHFIRYRV